MQNNSKLIVAGVVTTIVLIVVIAGAFLASNFSENSQNTTNVQPQPQTNIQNNPQPAANSDAEPPALESIGFTLDYYDPKTEMAGEMKFTKTKLQFDQIWSDFGQRDPRTTDTTKRNPQPTYILPVGTKVQSLIDGIVVEVKQLYSNDYTIMIKKDNESKWIFETEHVDKPIVKVGDKVTGGQVIAEVSSYDSQNHPGFGTLEIGILYSLNNRPAHACPFKYLDTSIKDDIYAKINALYTSWETYIGKDIYKQENNVSPGCVTEEPFVE